MNLGCTIGFDFKEVELPTIVAEHEAVPTDVSIDHSVTLSWHVGKVPDWSEELDLIEGCKFALSRATDTSRIFPSIQTPDGEFIFLAGRNIKTGMLHVRYSSDSRPGYCDTSIELVQVLRVHKVHTTFGHSEYQVLLSLKRGSLLTYHHTCQVLLGIHGEYFSESIQMHLLIEDLGIQGRHPVIFTFRTNHCHASDGL